MPKSRRGLALLVLLTAFAASAEEPWVAVTAEGHAASPAARTLMDRARALHTTARYWAFGSLPRQPVESLHVALMDDSREKLPSCYAPEERCVYVGLTAPVDDLAHEMGHAFVDMLKPGFRLGAARILHESIADMTAVLSAYRDPATAARILRETAGDLRRENDATRIEGSTCLRSARSPLTLDRIGFDRRRVTLSEVEVPDTLCDPHHVSSVLTSALHDVFCALYEADSARATGPEEAMARSADLVGGLMFRALLLVGEHRVCLRDYASALLRADRRFFDSRCGNILGPILLERGFFASDEELHASYRQQSLPDFRLDAAERDRERILARLLELEDALLAQVRGIPAGRTLDRYAIPLLFHRHTLPHPLFVNPDTVTLDCDLPTPEGCRLLRVRYLCPLDPATQRAYETMLGGTEKAIREAESPQEAFATCLFDPDGRLVELHADRPMPAILHGYL